MRTDALWSLHGGAMLRGDLMSLRQLEMGDIRHLRQAGLIEYVKGQGRPDYMRLTAKGSALIAAQEPTLVDGLRQYEREEARDA